MHPLTIGFVSGAAAGVVMGLLSDLFFRLRIFRSSLVVIDGSFLFRTLKLRVGTQLIYGAGLFIHLMTSGVFGAIYVLAGSLLGLNAMTIGSFTAVSLYVALLWLSMLFIALPVAGEGLFGSRSGSFTWLEQLILHAIFSLLYYGCLRVLHP